MKASDEVQTWLMAGCALGSIFGLSVLLTVSNAHQLGKPAATNPPDTAGFWQQANSATEQNCRSAVLISVLRMQLPESAYSDPALAKAMQEGYELCLMKNKVMI